MTNFELSYDYLISHVAKNVFVFEKGMRGGVLIFLKGTAHRTINIVHLMVLKLRQDIFKNSKTQPFKQPL